MLGVGFQPPKVLSLLRSALSVTKSGVHLRLTVLTWNSY